MRDTIWGVRELDTAPAVPYGHATCKSLMRQMLVGFQKTANRQVRSPVCRETGRTQRFPGTERP